MEIILIRHGQAEERSSDQPDEGRNLTAEGRKRLEKSLPGYCHYLSHRDQILIWSSPLLRAMQTAEIIARELQVKNIRSCDFMASGDFDTFMDTLSGVDDGACLILVGHEPHLGEWSQRICGSGLPFKKGAAAGFRLKTLSPLSGELLWFAQPCILIRQGG